MRGAGRSSAPGKSAKRLARTGRPDERYPQAMDERGGQQVRVGPRGEEGGVASLLTEAVAGHLRGA
jgi:hypothetical protein